MNLEIVSYARNSAEKLRLSDNCVVAAQLEDLANCVEMQQTKIERLQIALDDASETLQLHQASGDYEAGRRLGEKASLEMIEKQQGQVERLRRDYTLFEELSPPDVPRARFVQWCFDAWEYAQEMAVKYGGETDAPNRSTPVRKARQS